MVAILMMSTKLVALGLLKIKVSWNKNYNVINSVHDVINKILSRDSNYIVDVVMWLKFGNTSISMREIIVTTVLQGLDQKNQFFWRVLLAQVQQFGTGTRYGLQILHHCDKSVKTKRQKVFGDNSYVCWNCRRKIGRVFFLPPLSTLYPEQG